MVDVGFNPRGGGEMAWRRGATLEGLIARPSADSGVATRRGSVFQSVRGLKTTAIVMPSLSEAEPAVPWRSKSEIRTTASKVHPAIQQTANSALRGGANRVPASRGWLDGIISSTRERTLIELLSLRRKAFRRKPSFFLCRFCLSTLP